eukprot:6212429-Pleurochrysis_carterae.AAC.2
MPSDDTSRSRTRHIRPRAGSGWPSGCRAGCARGWLRADRRTCSEHRRDVRARWTRDAHAPRVRAARAHSTRASSARRLRTGHPFPQSPFGTAAGPFDNWPRKSRPPWCSLLFT